MGESEIDVFMLKRTMLHANPTHIVPFGINSPNSISLSHNIVESDHVKQKGTKPHQLLPNLIGDFNFLESAANSKQSLKIFKEIRTNVLS